jgi:FkbM family methyltransferase
MSAHSQARLEKLGDDLLCFWAMGRTSQRLFRAEKRLAAFYLRILRGPRNLAFDIGANRGEYAKVLASLFKKVVCFEPQPALAEEIRKKTRAFLNLLVVNCAISNCVGQAVLHLSGHHEMSPMEPAWIGAMQASGRFGDNRWEQSCTVETMTLDEAILEHGIPDYLKVDVEGHEEKVFATLKHPVRQISFECTPEARETARAVVQKIAGIGKYRFLPLCTGELPRRPTSLPLRSLEEIEALLAPESFYTPNYLDLFVMAGESR